MFRKALLIASVTAGLSLCAFARSKPKPEPASTIVDSGSFGVFVSGQRVATEKFVIRRFEDGGSSTSVDLEVQADGKKVLQNSEMRLAPNGSLRRYEWHQTEPGKSTCVVEPKDAFLVEHSNVNGKSTERPVLVSPTTPILDDYFFSHRELLLWRYVAANCEMKPSEAGCTLAPQKFGVVDPHQQESSLVGIEFKGQQDVPVKGQSQKMDHFSLTSDGPEWHLFVNSTQKLMMISIPESNTEIVRD